MSRGYLVLETGETYPGRWWGGLERAGEVVFNTSHSGYEEIATDSSYFSQIVVMTAPMQGNYGVNSSVWESNRLWIEGFICLQMQNSVRDQLWRQRLNEHSIPCISEVDTRAITLRLRSGGTPWGALVQAEDQNQAQKKAQILIQQKKQLDKDWVFQVSRREKEIHAGHKSNHLKVAVLDFGAKENILRELKSRVQELVIFPSRSTAEEILSVRPNGLMLTNGPGDPADVQKSADTVRELVGRLPIFGICMGHQILGIALGAKTYKLRFGHRGSNHPIKDSLLNCIYMTSQNHGYAVDRATLPAGAQVTHINLNDQTVAGIYNRNLNYLGIQYHPESHPGPHEAVRLFDFFVEKMMGALSE